MSLLLSIGLYFVIIIFPCLVAIYIVFNNNSRTEYDARVELTLMWDTALSSTNALSIVSKHVSRK